MIVLVRLGHYFLTMLASVACALALVGCTSLPSLEGRTATTALSTEHAHVTSIGRAIQPVVARHPDLSGLHPLDDPLAAFAARVILARYAERSIDAQYYIWQNDITGIMLLVELVHAARRGVRVRLLVDDNGIGGLDDALAALDAEPNFEVRLFNPFTYRHPKWANYLTAFSRLNHRMHNKSFTVDNQVSIIGGRNIGDNYFAATGGVAFADLDVQAIGPVVPDVSRDFDRYWASRLSYPIDRIVGTPKTDALARFHARAIQLSDDASAGVYRQALAGNHAVRELSDGTVAFTWAHTRMVSDEPEKALGRSGNGEWMIDNLAPVFAATTRSLQLVSPYLVLGAEGARDLIRMAERGVDVRVLTNSLAATDVTAVHAGYAKRRKQLVQAGIKLYELASTGEQPSNLKFVGSFGSSGSSLHAKTFAVDGERLFIGSFNFDPRSANLNTEMGFLIESSAFAQALRSSFEQKIPELAYEVGLNADGAIYWLRHQNGKVLRYTSEPETSLLRRMTVRFLALLPIDWLL